MSYTIPDAIWTWWNHPEAVYSSGYNSTYIGWMDNEPVAGIWVGRYYHPDNLLQQTRIGSVSRDDHNNPAVLCLSEDGPNPGRILVVWSEHGGISYSKRSTNPGSIVDWEPTFILNTSSGSYAQIFQVNDSSGSVYWFRRDGVDAGRYQWKLRISQDGGDSWGSGIDLFGYDNGSGLGGTVYPQFWQSSPNRIDCILNDSHPNNLSNNLYHFYIDIQSGGSRTFHKSDGTVIQPQFTSENLTRITSDLSWAWDGHTYNNIPYALYTTFSGGSNTPSHIYNYCYYSGGNWISEKICDAGTTSAVDYLYTNEKQYSAGLCLDPNNKDIVYLSREYGSGDFRIEKWIRDGGGSWSLGSNINGASLAINARPLSVVGESPSRILFWGGSYTSYGNYNANLYSEPEYNLITTKTTNPQWNTAWAPNGVAAYYLLHEGSGTSLEDVSPNNYNATFVGSPIWNSGSRGPYINNFSTSNYITSNNLALDANNVFLSGNYPFWISFRARSNNTAFGTPLIFSNSANTNNFIAFAYNWNNISGVLRLWVRDSAGSETCSLGTSASSPYCSDNQWHHILAVFDSGNYRRLLIDGNNVSEGSASMGSISINQFTIGQLKRNTSILPFSGDIDSVVVGWGEPLNVEMFSRDMIQSQYAGTFSVALSAPSITITDKSNTTIDLSWTEAIGGDISIDGYSYQLQRASDSGGSPGTFANIGSPQSTRTYHDTGLDAETTYWYRVIVTDDNSDTATSNSISATTDSNPASSLFPGIISFVSSGPGGISLEESTAPSGSITDYTRQWQRSDDGGSYSSLSFQTGILLYDSGVVEGVVYRYTLEYTDSVTTSGYSNIITSEVYTGGELNQTTTTGGRRVYPRYIGF